MQVLRTALVQGPDGRPAGRVLPLDSLSVPVHLLTLEPGMGVTEVIASHNTAFDLSQPPFVRAVLAAPAPSPQLKSQRSSKSGSRGSIGSGSSGSGSSVPGQGQGSILVVSVHHVVTDGVSQGLITRQLIAAYNTIRRGGQQALAGGRDRGEPVRCMLLWA